MNDVDFDTNINRDVYMKSNVTIYIICIVICIIYVHDDVYVSAYEYVHGCVDVCVNDNDYCYCICVCI